MGNNYSAEKRRHMSSADAVAMAFGTMVGWGAFVMPGTTFLPVAGPAGTVIAMTVGFDSWQSYINSLDKAPGIESVPTFYAAKAVMGQGGLILAGVTALAAVLTGIIGGYRATINMLTTMAEETGSEGGYGSYELRVRDTGIGISKEFAEKMFTDDSQRRDKQP